MSLNKTFHIGNLTREPETKHTQSGITVCDFSIAVNQKTQTKGEVKDDTVFLDFSCFGKLADNVSRYCHKGYSVMVEGRVTINQWTDKTTGKPRKSIKFIAERVEFLNTPRSAGSSQNPEPTQQQSGHRYTREDAQPFTPAPEEPPMNDDVPF